MNLRQKLLVLLAAVALLPLAVLAVLEFTGTRAFADRLDAANRADVESDLSRILAREVAANARRLDQDAQIAGLALRLQAGAVERALERPAPARRLYFASAFDGPERDWPPGTAVVHLSGAADAFPASFAVGSVLVPPGVSPESVRGDLQRLDATIPLLRDLRREYGDVVFLQFTALENGARDDFPGHGNYPPNYDSRRRNWYVTVKREQRRIWTPPLFSASTKQLTFITAMPVYGPQHRFAGVSAVEIPFLFLLRAPASTAIRNARSGADLTEFAGVAHDLETKLVTATATNGLTVVAQRTGAMEAAAWKSQPKHPTLVDGVDPQFGAVVADVAAGRPGIARFIYAGGDQLWIYAPVPSLHAALLQILPYAVIRAASDVAGASLRREATGQVQLTGIVALVMVAIVTVVGFIVAGAATKSFRDLATVAIRVGEGDLEARADVRGNDEIAALGRTFNAMIPKLQDGLRMQQSLELARAVQQNLLPLRPPVVPGFDIAGASEYCDETGGDYYDFVDLSHDAERNVAIAVGDVSGHGIAAALLMASARAALRGAIGGATAPGDAMERANRLLCADITDGSFMTLVLLVLDPATGVVRWVNAAHEAPLLYHFPTDAFVPLIGSDVPLGVDETWTYVEHTTPIPAGDVLLALGTDGIWETENPSGAAYGRERWERLVREHARLGAADLCRTILADVASFRGPSPPVDDVTLVIIKFTAAPNA